MDLEQLKAKVNLLRNADDLSLGPKGQLDSEDLRLLASDGRLTSLGANIGEAITANRALIAGIGNPNIKPSGLTISDADWNSLSAHIRTQFPSGVSDELRKRAGIVGK